MSTNMMRRPIAAIALDGPSDEGEAASTHGVAVICDDGSFFTYNFYSNEGKWVRYPGIPGTPGEAEKEEEDAAEREASNRRMLASLGVAAAKQRRAKTAK
jgi:hypothetical protein